MEALRLSLWRASLTLFLFRFQVYGLLTPIIALCMILFSCAISRYQACLVERLQLKDSFDTLVKLSNGIATP